MIQAIFSLLLFATNLQAFMFHMQKPSQLWEEAAVEPFDEMILSWNGQRSTEECLIFVSLKTEQWSPWHLYAFWDSSGQGMCAEQDVLCLGEGKKATGFRVKIVGEGISALHVYTNSDTDCVEERFSTSALFLDVEGISQMTLNHHRNRSLCSPTSLTAVLRYLTADATIDPTYIAQCVWDSNNDIFGRWVLNVAAASSILGEGWTVWVERLPSFTALLESLERGFPVIVSIKGPIRGGAGSYAYGHLIVVSGYDPLEQMVYCMDPAFPSAAQTHVCYPLADFLTAWNRRNKLAYIFHSFMEKR